MNNLNQKPVWLDCDPGHDDVMAIIMACFHPSLNLLGISTVAGNQSVEKTFQNAANTLAAIGKSDIPLFQGQAKALFGELPFCEEIHGSTGLDNRRGEPVFPNMMVPENSEPGLIFIHKFISEYYKSHDKKVQFVATGSLTNLALLILLYPEICSMIEITLMGGALGIGNTNPVAEFNIENDPEAARIVFESGIPLTMVPLEVTHSVLVTPEITKRIGSDTPFKLQVQELLAFFKETYQKVFFLDSPPLHDPVAVYFLIAQQNFEGRKMRVDIETTSSLSRGQTVCDFYGRSTKTANCFVALSVNVDAFWEDMILCLEKVNAV